jgi:spoIIIJ-associated protein
VSQGESAVGGAEEGTATVDTIDAVAGGSAGRESATGEAAVPDEAGDELTADEGAAEEAAADDEAAERAAAELAGDDLAAVPGEAGDELTADDEAADELAADEMAGDELAADDEAAERADLELEGEIAADYVEGLLDVADLDGDIDMDVEGDRAVVSVVGATLEELVGARGEVLEALQELTRLAVHRQTGMRTRIMLDVGGYRQRRRLELAAAGQDAAEEVRRTGTPKRLWAMNPFERKVVHDAVAAAGLRSESEGEEPERRVVVLPAS